MKQTMHAMLLTGFGGPEAVKQRQCRQHRRNHGAAAMELQLGHVFAGFAARCGKPKRQRLIKAFAAGRIAQLRQ